MKTLLGGILLAIGILIAGASGLCTGFVLIAGTWNRVGLNLVMILMTGGIPFAIGVGLCFAGRALIRRARSEQLE